MCNHTDSSDNIRLHFSLVLKTCNFARAVAHSPVITCGLCTVVDMFSSEKRKVVNIPQDSKEMQFCQGSCTLTCNHLWAVHSVDMFSSEKRKATNIPRHSKETQFCQGSCTLTCNHPEGCAWRWTCYYQKRDWQCTSPDILKT